MNESALTGGVAGMLFFAWIFVGACGLFGWWLIMAPIVVVSLWRAEAFEARTQAWLDSLMRSVYTKIFNK